MRVLVTGHLGFIGSHFYRHYYDHSGQHEVVGIDVLSGDDCRDFFRRENDHFDLIIHCAAIVGGRKMIDGNPLGVAVDLAIDAEMFQWALRTKVGRVVYFSSSAAYPIYLQAGDVPQKLSEGHIDLDEIHKPDMSYGWTKLTGEYQAEFLKAEGIPVHIFRPFSGYGTDQALDYPFPSFIDRINRFANPFEIWGDGQQVRDFVHVDDIVATVVKAIEVGFTEPLNIGTGTATNFNDLFEFMLTVSRSRGGKFMDYAPVVSHLETNPVGVQYRVADTTRLHTLRIPQISLWDGVERALKGEL